MFTTDTEYCKEAKTGNLILKEQNKKHLPPGFTVTFEKGINVVPLVVLFHEWSSGGEGEKIGQLQALMGGLRQVSLGFR